MVTVAHCTCGRWRQGELRTRVQGAWRPATGTFANGDCESPDRGLRRRRQPVGVWRAHRIGQILREAREQGVVRCGLSAGSLCWFAEAHSGSHGQAYHDQLRPASRAFWLNPGPSGVAEVELATAYLREEPAQPSQTAAIAA